MNGIDAESLVKELYLFCWNREPTPAELSFWAAKALESDKIGDFLKSFRVTNDYKEKYSVPLQVLPGHFYSPIVDPKAIQPYYNDELSKRLDQISAIDVDETEMNNLWSEWAAFLRGGFMTESNRDYRFNLDNIGFPYGDAAYLRATIAHARPTSIIEIGSGYSTACMLDAIEEFELDTAITCIDPNPNLHLSKAIRKEDFNKITLMPCKVQDVSLSIFEGLKEGDILFIDSTHVMKTASDVHFEFFHILPTLRPGVIIHFHDCPFPFEYPRRWLFDKNWSWNEIYALRAFLMYNKSFKVRFWSTLFVRKASELVSKVDPKLVESPGSGIWLERI